MVTVFAIILTIVGCVLFAMGPRATFAPFTFPQNIGGFTLVLAFVLWAVVFISLFWQMMAWLWVHAP